MSCFCVWHKKKGLFRQPCQLFVHSFRNQKKLISRNARLVEDYITCSWTEWWAMVFLSDRLCLASYSVIQFSLSVQSPALTFSKIQKWKGIMVLYRKEENLQSVLCLSVFYPYSYTFISNKSLVEWTLLLSHVCMHALPPTLQNVLIPNTDMRFLIDKCKSVPPCDASEHWEAVLVVAVAALCVSLIIFTDLFPSLASGFQEVLSTLSSASHNVHQRQPQFPMCRDDAVSTAMMLSLPYSPSPAVPNTIVLHRVPLCLCRCLMPASTAPLFCAHAVSSLAFWFSPALQPLLPLFLSLSPHKDLFAWCCCWLEALEPDRGEASSLRSYSEGVRVYRVYGEARWGK